MNRIVVSKTDSTSNYLRKLCSETKPPEFTVVVTEFQTAGKGQRDNKWESAPGENLLFSLLLRPVFLPAREQFILSQITALSIQETLSTLVEDITIKWPNDIYRQNKKICGILIENDLSGTIITESIHGIGININQTQFISEVPNPVSLKQITGLTYDRNDILNKIISRIKNYYAILREGKKEQIMERYRNALYRKSGIHWYEDETGAFEASIKDVEPSGILNLTDLQGNIRSYSFKEVRFIIYPEETLSPTGKSSPGSFLLQKREKGSTPSPEKI